MKSTTTRNSAGCVSCLYDMRLQLMVFQDAENNTILMLIADLAVPTTASPYMARPDIDSVGAGLRMSRMYWDRYPWILDWSNIHGKTALHMAALKGNEELAGVSDPFCAEMTMAHSRR